MRLPACFCDEQVGTLTLKDPEQAASHHLTTWNDGHTWQVFEVPEVVNDGLTLESALFPFLFPLCTGMYRKGKAGFHSLCEYLHHRMHMWFSPYTLFKMYPLHMWQLRQCNVIANSVRAQPWYEC
jgi:hypothetical protein